MYNKYNPLKNIEIIYNIFMINILIQKLKCVVFEEVLFHMNFQIIKYKFMII